MPKPQSLAAKVAAKRLLNGLPGDKVLTDLQKQDEYSLKHATIKRYEAALRDFHGFLQFEDLPLKYHHQSDDFEPAPTEILKQFAAFYAEGGEGRLADVHVLSRTK